MTTYDLRKAQKEIRDGKPTIEEIRREAIRGFARWWFANGNDERNQEGINNIVDEYLKGEKGIK